MTSFDEIGPPLPALLRRLAETPADFLAEPRIGGQGQVVVSAVVGDVLDELGLDPYPELLRVFTPEAARREDRNWYRLALVTCWLLADDWLAPRKPSATAVGALLTGGLRELAPSVRADVAVTDPDRREELARTFLARLGFRPEGESAAEAADRLTMISAAERQRLVEASRAAEARAREVRDALARKAAAESADKWTRE